MSTQKFDKLYYRLQEHSTWPNKYMFKFIVPNEDNKVEIVKSLLPSEGEFSYKHTKSLHHVSITCIAYMNSAGEIVEITEKVSQLEGVMVL